LKAELCNCAAGAHAGKVAASRRPVSRGAALRGRGRREGIVCELFPELSLDRHLLERHAGGRAGRIGRGQVEVIEYLLDYGRIRKEGENDHDSAATGAGQCIDVKDPLEHLSP